MLSQHGSIILRRIIKDLEDAAAEFGEDWPDDFDPNDIGLYQSVLTSLSAGVDTGYDEQYWWGKPFRFFMAAMQRYCAQPNSLSSDELTAIRQALSEYQARISNIRMVDGCFQES